MERPDLGRCARTPHKARFSDEGRAREATARHYYGKPVYTYYCTACRGWHLTSKEPRR